MTQVTKAVILAAGYGTRFLPATKSQPKEMLPLVDRPIIHYAVQEAVDSGIDEVIIVTSHGKSADRRHTMRRLPVRTNWSNRCGLG